MGKKDFDKWEILPESVSDRWGKRAKGLMKNALVEAIKEMDIPIGWAHYEFTNKEFLRWLVPLAQGASIELLFMKGETWIDCDFIEEDYDADFIIRRKLRDALKSPFLSSKQAKLIAADLRKFADELDKIEPNANDEE